MIGSLSFADDKIVQPLQAADLLAYEISKTFRGFNRAPGKVLNELTGSHVVWSKSSLLEYADAMKQKIPELFEP